MKKKNFLVVMVVMVAGVLFTSCSAENRAIDIVKNGAFYALPDVTVVTLYDSILNEPDWSLFLEEDGFHYVDGSGYTVDDNVFFNIRFQVDLDDDEFGIYAIQMGEEVFTDEFMINVILTALIEVYEEL